MDLLHTLSRTQLVELLFLIRMCGIYAISKLMQAKYLGLEIKRSISFTTRDFLIQTNRPTLGSQYEQFKQSLDRLTGTRIMTEVKTGEKSQTDFLV